MQNSRPQPIHVPPAQVLAAVAEGIRRFTRVPLLSVAFSMCFAIIGIVLLGAVIRSGFAPMSFPLIGGFLLVAPALLSGFCAIARADRDGRTATWQDIVAGFRNMPRDLWGLLLVCGFLFVIWITDAGILYSFMVGKREAGLEMLLPPSNMVFRFELGAAVAGAFFALIVFCITAYAVPLLIDRRANLVVAVSASVRAVFRSVPANMLWAFLLGATVIGSVILPPLLAVVLPVMAFASEALYREVFPVAQRDQ